MNKEQLIQLVKTFDKSALLSKSYAELDVMLGSDFAAMRGYNQNNPHHCYNLLEHTARTVEAIDINGLSETEAYELRIAALYHDIGKIAVASEKDGRTVFYNHSQKSREIAEKALSAFGFKGASLNKILFYIAHHDDFISFKSKKDIIYDDNSKPITIKTVYERIIATQANCEKKGIFVPSARDYALLMRLCIADAKAQNPKVIQNGIIIDSRDSKLARLNEIANIITVIGRAESERCDLHTHSTYSDGTDTPSVLVEKAAQLGLKAVALTDHNTIDGLREFTDASKRYNIDAVPGIEFSTEYENHELHIIGLFIEKKHYRKVSKYVAKAREAKEESNRLLISNLQNEGYDIDYGELESFAVNGNINRAVIAKYLVSKGIIKSVKEGFATVLSKSAGFYIPSHKPGALDTIKFIKSIGAVAVLAHPLLDLSEDELKKFLPLAKSVGLDAVEAYYSTFSQEQSKIVETLAKNNRLVLSGGSDYHGEVKPHISLGSGTGDLLVSMNNYLGLIEKLLNHKNEKYS